MKDNFRKILIIRLSSIGDIVLTTPVIRSLRLRFPDAGIHFLTKKSFHQLLEFNPNVDKLHLFDGDLNATISELREEKFDLVVDLHRNIRSRIIKTRLGVKSTTYSKDRWPVWMYTKFRIGTLPQVHTVERYARATARVGCEPDEKGLDFFIPEEYHAKAREIVKGQFEQKPIAIVLGGKFATKRWPREYVARFLQISGYPAILLGGPGEKADADFIMSKTSNKTYNACGTQDLLSSAALLDECDFVLTNDTGLMHIAVALGKKVFSIWGNTIPDLGFAPYRSENSVIIQESDLKCRPCSKLGYDSCPKKHFKCMMDLTPEKVTEVISHHQVPRL